jgi:hypothetical protein
MGTNWWTNIRGERLVEKLIGRRGRRSACVATLVAAIALAFPALAAAELTEAEGAVLGSFAGTPGAALSYWTPARMEDAEPLSVLTLPGPPPAGGSTAAVRSGVVAQAATTEGIDTGDPTLFPNRANGKIFGAYRIGSQLENYQCSGSVVESPGANVGLATAVVLTAAHCVIDPETGVVARFVIFVPGYREHEEPFGTWEAGQYATTEAWKKTAKVGSVANEGGDMALLVMNENEEEESLEEVVKGSLGIAFDQACNQTYTQYGYPAELPYDGEILYSHTAAYAGPDTNLSFSPEPMKIASDFTPGSSGGPWTVGPSTSPTAVSVTDYGYEQQPGIMYGAYFGEEARAAYELASGQVVAAGIGEKCKPLPETTVPTEPTPTAPSTSPPSTPSTTPTSVVSLRVTRVRRRANGSAVLTAKVGSAGTLKLSGSAVRAESVNAQAAGKYRLIVAPKGAANRWLRRRGRAEVGVKIAFSASGETRRLSRQIRLSQR